MGKVSSPHLAISAPIRRSGSPAPFARPLRGAALHLLAPRAGRGQADAGPWRREAVRQSSSIQNLRPRSPSQAPRPDSGLSSEIRWFDIAWDLGQNEADPG